MPSTYGYSRHPAPYEDLAGVEAQQKLIQEYGEKLGLEPVEFLVDAAGAHDTPWLSRPAGQALADRLSPGNSVVLADLAAVYTGVVDLRAAIAPWIETGIILHVVKMRVFDSERRNNLPISHPDGPWSFCSADESAAEGMMTALQFGASFEEATT